MNDDEPTYEYVRGYGWMPCDIPTLSRVIGKYQWTLQLRDPGPKEHFWCVLSDDTLEMLMDCIKDEDCFDEMPGALLYNSGEFSDPKAWGSKLCVITRVKLYETI
jgi:hypothetical protein